MNLATIYIKDQDFNLNKDIIQSLSKGSAWSNLYDPYKFTKNTLSNDIKTILQAYYFMLTELRLYLDTHSNNKEALEMYLTIKEQFKKALNYTGGENYVDL